MTHDGRAVGLRKIFPKYSTAGWYTQAKYQMKLARKLQKIKPGMAYGYVMKARGMVRAGRQMQNERSLS